jgi:LPXTG-motif cell wall-anchored protein
VTYAASYAAGDSGTTALPNTGADVQTAGVVGGIALLVSALGAGIWAAAATRRRHLKS